MLLLELSSSSSTQGPSWAPVKQGRPGAGGTEQHLQARAHVRIGGHAARDDQVAQARVRLARPAARAPRALLQVRNRHALERGCDVGAHLATGFGRITVEGLGFNSGLNMCLSFGWADYCRDYSKEGTKLSSVHNVCMIACQHEN